jgi:glutamate synthase (NADPH/NADH) small chain
MGKPTGFLEYTRTDDLTIPVKERVENFDEFHTMLDEDERRIQGARCMDCGVPLCQSALELKGRTTGCPLHNLIPEWNDEIYHGHIRNAAARLLKTNNFPEFTGRVCPALCEKACICGLNDAPVTNRNNELYIIEQAYLNGYIEPRIPKVRSGCTVAVIGSGPAGLAAADQLNHRGHSVTVFERDDRVGGLLMYGIPNMKLDKEVILRRRRLMEEEGVEFITGVDVGKTVPASEILEKYDAVALCCGSREERPVEIDGVENPLQISGVYNALDFLTGNTKRLLDPDGDNKEFINAKGKNVVIVGGGDTANDCVGTSIRLGCKSVTQLIRRAAPPKVRKESNPWPEWPNVELTDYGQEEAIEIFGSDPRMYESIISELVLKNDKLSAVKVASTTMENGRVVKKEGTEKTLKCELLIFAAGYRGCQMYVPEAFGVNISGKNTVKTIPNTYHTNVDKVFTAGDMHRGQSLVVWAIAEGRECARQIDEYLMGYTNMP